MRNKLAPALFGLALFFGFIPGAKAQMVQIAICMEGGCSCHVPGTTLSDVEIILGTPNPPDAAGMTLVVYENEYSWRSQTPAQIDASFGGPGSCPIQLEAPLIPEDGTWRITAGTTDTSACPLFSLTGQAVPGQVSGETRQIRWGGWFSPSKLMSEAIGNVNWTSTGGHSWRGVLADERQSNGSGTTGASVVWHLTLVSPTEITGSSVFEYDISSGLADAAAQSILQNMQCRTATPFTAEKVG
ncbi:hypothetical protein AKG11_32245 [Shinella sp. SUS2]|uniref:hypothetical protein n=1 Tax=unclassified Shinella TaxID=2643062 RepID=UPI0006815012|nr:MULTISPECIES: hypothetical protein [unclassified Shinella]KNY12902.1 hypothetical protein AKG11_32245 [Shinella sp. SUS2]KOC71627.1 hypothetical protein AKG10_31940 [Shinella sp. GWS1]